MLWAAAILDGLSVKVRKKKHQTLYGTMYTENSPTFLIPQV